MHAIRKVSQWEWYPYVSLFPDVLCNNSFQCHEVTQNTLQERYTLLCFTSNQCPILYKHFVIKLQSYRSFLSSTETSIELPPPPHRDLFISITFDGRGGGVSGRNRPGGIFEMGVLFCLAKTMVSVHLKELKYKMDTPQVREVGGHAGKDQ